MKAMSLAVMLCAVFGANLFAQDCPARPQAERDRVWMENTAVVIWVDPAFRTATADLTAHFQEVADNWRFSSAATMMGVTISFTDDRSQANVRVLRQAPPDGISAGRFNLNVLEGLGVYGGDILINPDRITALAVGQTFAHELGHPFGLTDCSFCPAESTVMNNPGPNSDTSRGLLGPNACDLSVIQENWEATFSSDPCDQYCGSGVGDGDGCYCPGGPLKCSTCTPVVVDVDGDGIDLTTAADGVDFALSPGAPSRLAWTLAGDDDGWLALDRNCSGTIDDGSELFGNYTEQPLSVEPNGYEALAVFDGNGDRRIDAADAVFGRLLLWIDGNHDGRSTSDELVPLAGAGIESIDLAYRTSGRHDQHGNSFRYRAKVTSGGRERWSYDVLLSTLP